MGTITQEVSLSQVRFFSPIGFYEEEQVLGNEFFVDVSVRFPFENLDTEDLQNTLNYAELYVILQEVMRPKRKLIESAAQAILMEIRTRYLFTEEITVRITKTTPPFGTDSAHSAVCLQYKR